MSGSLPKPSFAEASAGKLRRSQVPAQPARGGFNFPLTPIVGANAIIIQGWAQKVREPLVSAEIQLSGVPLGDAGMRSWNPNELDPDETEFWIFSLSLKRSDPRLAALDLRRPVRAYARCTFLSGAELMLCSPDFHWKEDCPAVPCGAIAGSLLESVKMRGGRLELEGWIASHGVDEPRFFLEGTRRIAEIEHRPELGNTISWFHIPEVESRFLKYSGRRPFGFRLSFNPNLIGRAPGHLRLLACGADRRFVRVAGGEALSKRMTALAAKFSPHPHPAAPLAQYGLSLLGRYGLRGSKVSGQQIAPAVADPETPARSLYPRKRLLFVTHNLSDTEGAPRVLKKLIEYIRRISPDTFIAVASPVKGPLSKSFDALGIETRIFPELHAVHHRTWTEYVAAVQPFSQWFAKIRPDLVCANTVDAFWGIDQAFHTGVRSAWIIHESIRPAELFPQMDPQLKMQVLSRLPGISKAVFVAKETEKLFSPSLAPEKFATIPNGVDVEEIDSAARRMSREKARAQLKIEPETTVISIVGTTCFRKGQDIFLKEAAILRRTDPSRKYHFFIVGCRELPFLRTLKDLCRNIGLEQDVTFVDETPDVAPYFIASDVMVMASREESAPLVSLESFAFRRPLVSTSVFGLSEQIAHERNALAFSPLEEGDLARQVLRLLNENGLAARLVKQARADVETTFHLRRSLEGHWECLSGI